MQLDENERKELIVLKLVCNGKVHYRRPHNHPDILELLKQMAEGKADGYSIRSASSNSDYAKSVMYQCPYDKSCKCSMEEPCKGCESWHPDFA